MARLLRSRAVKTHVSCSHCIVSCSVLVPQPNGNGPDYRYWRGYPFPFLHFPKAQRACKAFSTADMFEERHAARLLGSDGWRMWSVQLWVGHIPKISLPGA